MNLAWIDLETTGLEPTRDAILEIALVCTTPDLHVLKEESFVIDWAEGTEEIIALCSPYVLDMHEKNGLFTEMLSEPIRPFTKVDIGTAERLCIEAMRAAGCTGVAIGNDPYRSPMCGSTVSFDRGFLAAQMPDLAKCFSYRHVDVSSFKEMADRWYGSRTAAPGLAVHRALPDIHHSIASLRGFRVAHCAPGTTTATTPAAPGVRIVSADDLRAGVT